MVQDADGAAGEDSQLTR